MDNGNKKKNNDRMFENERKQTEVITVMRKCDYYM